MRLAQAYVAELEAEIERLRTDYGLLKDDYDAQRAEIERLRATLREIADSDVHWRAVNVARVALAALEGKFPTKKICPECGQPMREDGYCDHIPF